jgi:hypothetical protein
VRVQFHVHVQVPALGAAGAAGAVGAAAVETETGDSTPPTDGAHSTPVACAPPTGWGSEAAGVLQSQFQAAPAVEAGVPEAVFALVVQAQSQIHGVSSAGAEAAGPGTVTAMLELPPFVVVATAGAAAGPLVVVAVLV